LASQLPGEDDITVHVLLHGMSRRRLLMDDRDREPLPFQLTTTLIEIPYSSTLPREDLVADARVHAVRAAMYIFERFGWSADLELLQSMQSRLHR
jgi:hypothetical protein